MKGGHIPAQFGRAGETADANGELISPYRANHARGNTVALDLRGQRGGIFGARRDQRATLAFTEEKRVEAAVGKIERDGRAEVFRSTDGAFGQRDQEAALGEIVRAADFAPANGIANRFVHFLFAFKIEFRRTAPFQAMDFAQVKAGTEFLADTAFRWTAEQAGDWRIPPADHATTRYEEKRLGDCAPVFLDFERI